MSAGEPIELSSVPGLGPVRRAALEAAGVTDLRGLLEMTVEELAAVQGIGAWQAHKIREFLRQRGLLVETHQETAPDGHVTEVAVVREPRNAEEAAVIQEAVEALEAQARVEAELEEEARMLAEAVAQQELAPEEPQEAEPEAKASGRRGRKGASRPAKRKAAREPQADRTAEPLRIPILTEEVAECDEEPQAAQGSEEEAQEDEELLERLGAQREQLPETALSLIRGIRESAVAPQLTRQITRLLITASEFVSSNRPVPPDRREQALSTLNRAEQILQSAIEKRAFSQAAQRDLARRIRRRRKELEALLEG